MKAKNRKPQKGFALIVTLSLMILLTVVAVGLLTLSSISLRSSGQANAMSAARANAKMALMLAIGELQKAAGPDKTITATSEILREKPEKPNLTGVWDSWDYDVKSTNLDYDSPKSRKSGTDPGFRGWLVSDGDPDGPADRDYADQGFSKESIELVGAGSLGANPDAQEKVTAGKVRVSRNGKKAGAYAWHVADESVKARINTYRDQRENDTLAQKRALLAGQRPDASVMQNSKGTKLDFLPDDVADYSKAAGTVGKVVSFNQVELLDDSTTVRSFRNDVTPYSQGLLTNVREGGLKKDLTSLFELTTNGSTGTTGLPAGFNNNRVYKSSIYSGGSEVTGVSDPYWSAFAGYYNTYKELLTPDTSPKLYKSPNQDVRSSGSLVQPAQFSPAPVIAKVELLFSLLCREKHGPWKPGAGDYLVHMMYIPIITLHNPYNVSLQFDKMKVGMADVPVGFKFYVNGVAKSSTMTPLANLFVSAGGKKEFWLELADWPSATAANPSAAIVMKPGQTMVFGPYINASEPFGDGTASYFDYTNTKTGTEGAPLKAKRGFAGAAIGFDVDWLLPGNVFYANKTDILAVETKATVPPNGTSFRVSAQLTANRVTKNYGGLTFTYNTQAVLDRVLPATQRYPKKSGIVASSMFAANGRAPSSITEAKAFGLFSAYARTSNGGVDETGKRTTPGGSNTALFADGRLAGNPYLHNNAARVLISTDYTREKPGMQSHELNLISLNGSADDAFSIASDFRTNYLLNYRQVSGKSIKSGSYLEIPSGPLQAISDFRRSNVLASPYLPAFVQPIGNSYASPLIATNTAFQTGVASYQLLDHSVLANHALYDGFYFSTFAPLGGESAVDRFNGFMSDGKPLASQLFEPYIPNSKTLDVVRDELFSSSGKPTTSAYKVAAQYQMVKGAFNVNSTRVQAWKAMLSSMNRSQLMTLWPKSASLGSQASKGVPVPAMTLHNGTAIDGNFTAGDIDDQASNEWNGYRELSESQIDALANEIVRQVRQRGPFLSMSEFVNRRIGADSELTRVGALQAAIDLTKLNDSVYANQVEVGSGDISDTNLYSFKTPQAAVGNPAAGAPGWLSQADLLKILEPAATVRSDTFVIRTCGEATDEAGNVLARAYLEAVVQRVPTYVNPADPATARPENPNAPSDSGDEDTPLLKAPENIAFGRQFVMVSFKWLSANEI